MKSNNEVGSAGAVMLIRLLTNTFYSWSVIVLAGFHPVFMKDLYSS